MDDSGRLTNRQVLILLASPSTEAACQRARINKTTVYEWLKEEAFRSQELKRQRDAVIARAGQPQRQYSKGDRNISETPGQPAGEHQYPGGGDHHRVCPKGFGTRRT